jgi:hypothetical protein
MPTELSVKDCASLLSEMKADCIKEIEKAIQPGTKDEKAADGGEDGDESSEEPQEEGMKDPARSLTRRNCSSACSIRE